MNKITTALLITIGLFAIIVGVLNIKTIVNPKAGDNTSSYQYYGLGSETGALCGTSSVAIVASSTGSRQALKIYNDSSTALYLSLGKTAVLHQGITVPASVGSVVSLDTPTYQGAVYCISSSATASTTIEELK